jgi:hypothetical protein
MSNFKKTGLWKCQYAPREKSIKCKLTKKALKKWNKLSIAKKIAVIDNLQAKGEFD